SDEESDEKRVLDKEEQGRRGKGKPKTRWNDCIVVDMNEKDLDTNMTEDRGGLRQLIKNSNP
ncbi:hypothetical protein SK128_014121, partial [Halocaridina rubra]